MSTSRRVRALAASAAIASAIALSGSAAYAFPGTAKHLQPLPPSLVSEMERKDMTAESPILVRIFKQEAELEVWKQDRSGKYALLKTYPICRWSGELGPKVSQGDRQAPEGFYAITPGQMNPNSSYHLSFNIGYPNAFDRAHERSGSALMVHGDCLSAGCYAMTDEQISEIYALARDALAAGQPSFQVQALPFRMNPLNMARHRNNPNMPFWKNLKQGYDYFELSRQQPKVDVCEKRYVFNAKAPNSSKLNFDAADKCPAYEVPDAIASAVQAKARRDDVAILDLIKRGTPAAPIRTGEDGGMHPVFLAKVKNSSPFDPAGIFAPVLASAPGTVPKRINPPKPASPVYASTMAYAPEPGLDLVASIPVPRPGPRRENAPQTLTFAERFGAFSTASAEPLSLATERTGSFRLASAEITSPDSNPLAQQLLRSARLRVASADPSATPPDSTGTVPHEDAKPSSGKIASTFSRLLGIGRQANAAEKEKPAAAAAPTQTASLTMRPEEHQTRAANAALFQNTTIADMKPLTAPPLAAPPLTAQPVTVQAINFESRWSAMR